MAEFSSRLRELRARRKLRQRDLAEKLGVAQTTVANYEQGSRFPGEERDFGPLSPLARRYLDTLLARSREEAGRLVMVGP